MLVTSLGLQQIKVGTVAMQEDAITTFICKIQIYIILALSVPILGLVTFSVLHPRKLNSAEDVCSQTQLK